MWKNKWAWSLVHTSSDSFPHDSCPDLTPIKMITTGVDLILQLLEKVRPFMGTSNILELNIEFI